MPELPEVETIRIGLFNALIGAEIIQSCAYRQNLRYDIPAELSGGLKGLCIKNIRRRAKYLLFDLSNNNTIISHLGMSGSWVIKQPDEAIVDLQNITRDKHDHFSMLFKNLKGESLLLIYNDPRRFGFMFYEISEKINSHKALNKLGVEPLAEEFTGEYLYSKLSKRNISLKAALLDQNIIAGLGNIYVCEALWRSKISPFIRVSHFCSSKKNSIKDLQLLCDNIKDVLRESLISGGSSLKDYKNVNGGKGDFQNRFSVYNKSGHHCPSCNDIIQRTVQHGRSSFYCKSCQRL